MSSLTPREENRDLHSAKSSVRLILSVKNRRYCMVCLDDRFIMKQIKTVEISSFEQIAPLYFDHITTALENKVHMYINYYVHVYTLWLYMYG